MDTLSPLQCIILLDIYKSILGRKAFQESRHSVTRQAHEAAVRWTSMEGSERARATQDRHGKTEQLSSPHQRRSDRSMRMRTSEGDSRAFSLPMHQMDGIPHRDAAMYRDTQKQHIFLPRREDANRRKVLDSGPDRSPGNNTVYKSNRTT